MSYLVSLSVTARIEPAEEAEIGRRSSAFSQRPTCLDISAIDPREARAAVLHTAVDVNATGGAGAAESGGTRPTRRARPQGLTLVHFSAQLKHFEWDMGCVYRLFRGCTGGVRGCEGVLRMYFVSETAQVELKSGRV